MLWSSFIYTCVSKRYIMEEKCENHISGIQLSISGRNLGVIFQPELYIWRYGNLLTNTVSSVDLNCHLVLRGTLGVARILDIVKIVREINITRRSQTTVLKSEHSDFASPSERVHNVLYCAHLLVCTGPLFKFKAIVLILTKIYDTGNPDHCTFYHYYR